MKLRIWIVLLCVIGMAGWVSAGNMKSLEIHVGTLNPKGTPSGMLLGGAYGISVDEAVDIGLGVFYFWKTYKEDTEVINPNADPQIPETKTVTQELEYNTSLLPISFNVTMHFPVQPPLGFYAGGAISYQFLFSKQNNYIDDISERELYKGLGWIIRGGLEYQLGSRSSFIVEAFYNICKAKGKEEEKAGLPTWDEVDLNGLGFRAGVHLVLF